MIPRSLTLFLTAAYTIAGTWFAFEGNPELWVLAGLTSAAWAITAALTPGQQKEPEHTHNWDWSPHPIPGRTAATCHTCGEKAVF